ncbi:MAG: 4Fe-4S binding protein, partial [Mailhella sp.]|nr:4Fe-4S binding protein [Mailhella sp.]
MQSVRALDLSRQDLRWVIQHDPSRCTMCGSCIAQCAQHAIEAGMMRRDITLSRGAAPTPERQHEARPVIRQSLDPDRLCVGCGFCSRVCPNDAIRPVRNPDQRMPMTDRGALPAKRGGRTNVNTQRTLDAIVVGRISQMTDPALDSERHTFDMRAPLGRVLLSGELPLEVQGGRLVKTGGTPPVRWIYPLIFSDMSIGALSTRAWEAVALAAAYLNEECGLPVRMSSGEGGMPVRLLESDKLRYFILQIASGHFGWDRIIKAMPRMKADPAGILIKIGQGAKPGDGGLLPASKVAPHIQAIRGVPRSTLHSPPNHQGL